MANTPIKPQLWTKRPVQETIAVYADWAASYDADLAKRGYHTPARIADTLLTYLTPGTPILDYGCGTGLSGVALLSRGLGPIHGTDITQEMLDMAEGKGIYEDLWLSQPGQALPRQYEVIIAAGVVSLGAAPPECLDLLVDGLEPGGLLCLSFNDPTIRDGSYDARLIHHIDTGEVTIISREHGPHLDDMEMGSDIILLRRT